MGRWGVPALGFGTFAIGTCEFVLAGVLPQMSTSLGVSMAAAGQVVTTFAVTCAIAAPVLATVTARWPRRRVLLIAALVYVLGVAATAMADSFTAVLLTQLVAAAATGVYIPTSAVTAAALVPEHRRGWAIAVVTTGLTAAAALGAPLGTALGGLFGWRITMWFLAALAGVGTAGLLVLVPDRVPGSAVDGLRARLAPLRNRTALVLLATTLVGFTAVYIPYTYISVVFAGATGGDGVLLSVLMFVLGTLGAVGNFGAGALADRLGGRKVVTGALGMLAICLFALPLGSGSFLSALALVAAYGMTAFAITTPQQHRLISLMPDSASILVSLNAGFLYLAISLSGVLGAASIQWLGGSWLSVLAALLAMCALALSEWAARLTSCTHPQSAQVSL
ncbi:MFS transporter [Halostreptopolyspora alba]|uniref:MFS transporter n=1 Tax=Halostreptopolyspora alba TaxID=2487137 RepID=A0A3N0EGF9_9ACTN|nr:MFS transporter [Nocardiopsaceae bacterium YIM 96095]